MDSFDLDTDKETLLSAEQKGEIDSLRSTNSPTYRPTVDSLEDVLFKPLPVLDHGFVRVIDYMGDDSAIVQAARVSYGKGTKQARQDAGLIRYLMRHAHTTPFEMCEIKFHIKLPIFVARQWVRHRMASINEYSARYSILDHEFYTPSYDQLASQSTANRQGRGDVLKGDEAQRVLDILVEDAEQSYEHYMEMLNQDDQGVIRDENKSGLARELARMNLPLNYYTQWYWKIDLHNLFNFVQLRSDQHAQYEIRVYAELIARILKLWVPLAYQAFQDYRLGGVRISEKGLGVLRKMLSHEKVDQESSGMSRTEWLELMDAIRQKD
tara:strand:- start:439 stop:1410 length:972 start_codon:yes stop_codon:yes gene_type:complete